MYINLNVFYSKTLNKQSYSYGILPYWFFLYNLICVLLCWCLCTLCLQCWCLPVKKKLPLVLHWKFFHVVYRPMCEKNVKADKNQNTIFFNSYLCKFSICSNPRNVVFIKMWLHWISGCWNKSKTSKVTYCRYKYLYTCYQLVGIVKGWLQGFFFKLSYNVWSLFFGCCLRKMS